MAFRIAPSQPVFHKQKVYRVPEHLTLVRKLPSIVSGVTGCEPAHVNATVLGMGKFHRGKQTKASDWFTLPLTPDEHRSQHSTGDETDWWWSRGVEQPSALAAHLYCIATQHESFEEKVFVCKNWINEIRSKGLIV